VQGLKAYPRLSLQMARDFGDALFNEEAGDQAAEDMAADYVTDHLMSMLGFPDFVGAAAGAIVDLNRWLSALLGPFVEPIKKLIDDFEDRLFKMVFGFTLTELKEWLKSPETYINLSAPPFSFAPDTSARLDALIGLTTSGIVDKEAPLDLEAFAAMRNATTLAKLTLLDGNGLNQLLAQYGVPNHFKPHDDVMLGWARTTTATTSGGSSRRGPIRVAAAPRAPTARAPSSSGRTATHGGTSSARSFATGRTAARTFPPRPAIRARRRTRRSPRSRSSPPRQRAARV